MRELFCILVVVTVTLYVGSEFKGREFYLCNNAFFFSGLYIYSGDSNISESF